MKKDFTENEITALIHEQNAIALNHLADYIEKYQLNHEESAKLIRECSDELNAQAIVVKLRDNL